jgi:lactobin A/cerein 7B family class IIb bacteriocin
MESKNMHELSDLEISQVSGGVPVLAVVAAVIFVAGVAAGAYNAYQAAKRGK